MKIIDYLNTGVAVLNLAEAVFTEAEPLVEKLVTEGKELGQDAKQLFEEAKDAFNDVKDSGIAGSPTGKLAADTVADVTTLFANAKEAAGGDVGKLLDIGRAAEAQFKLLIAQLAGGIDVTAQPKA